MGIACNRKIAALAVNFKEYKYLGQLRGGCEDNIRPLLKTIGNSIMNSMKLAQNNNYCSVFVS